MLDKYISEFSNNNYILDYSYRDTTGDGILDTKKKEGINNQGINI